MNKDMIDEDVFGRVLTVGCAFHPPRGGIAQVLSVYEQEVFPDMKFVENSGGKGRCRRCLRMVYGLFAFVFRLLVDWRIRIVHIHTASYNSFRRSAVYVRLARGMGRKVVMTMHGGGFREYAAGRRTFVEATLARCACVGALSEKWRDYYRDELNCRHVEIIPNVVEAPVARAGKTADGIVRFLFLGAIVRQKGVYDLLETVAARRDELQGRFFLTIGGTGEDEQLQRFITDLNLGGLVEFVGWVSGPRKKELLARADVFVLPSYVEGVPVSLLEAMTYGLPVLATPVGGVPGIVDDDNGVLVPPGDCAALGDALVRLSEDAALRHRLGRAGCERVRPHLSGAVRERLLDIYAAVLREG